MNLKTKIWLEKKMAWQVLSAPFAFLAPLLAVAVAFFLKKEGGRRAKWRAPPLPPKTNGERRRSTPLSAMALLRTELAISES